MTSPCSAGGVPHPAVHPAPAADMAPARGVSRAEAGSRSPVLPVLRRMAAGAAGCPARAPSAVALGLAWRVRADLAFLAAAHAGGSPHPAERAQAPRLRRYAQTWAAGAARLARESEPSPHRLGWLGAFFERNSMLPEVGRAWRIMGSELAVYRLSRSILPSDPHAASPRADADEAAAGRGAGSAPRRPE